MFIPIDDNKLFALSFGSGPRTFLAVGGWIGSSEVWLPTLELLSPRWRTAAFDHRGAGESHVPLGAITYPALLEDVVRVNGCAGDRSLRSGRGTAGAQVVLDAVLRYPDRFDGAVLVDGSAGVPRPAAAGPAPISGLPSSWPGADHSARLRWFIDLCTPEPDVEHIRRWGHHILLRADPEAADRLWGIGRDAVPRLLEHLGDVRIPVLLVAGSADPLSPPAAMAELQRLLAHTRLVEVEGAGHVPIMTRPQTIAAAIDDYFTPDGTL